MGCFRKTGGLNKMGRLSFSVMGGLGRWVACRDGWHREMGGSREIAGYREMGGF